MSYQCIYKSARIGVYTILGKKQDAFNCQKLHSQCTETANLLGIPACDSCDHFLDFPSALKNCAHRGEFIRNDTANICGRRGEEIGIYYCKLHKCECALTRYCHSQEARVCVICEDSVVPDQISSSAKCNRSKPEIVVPD